MPKRTPLANGHYAVRVGNGGWVRITSPDVSFVTVVELRNQARTRLTLKAEHDSVVQALDYLRDELRDPFDQVHLINVEQTVKWIPTG